MSARIGAEFFRREPLICARELIGAEMRWGECAGIIVETEAYFARNDEASHTFSRPSVREFVARHPAGTAYVYFNYGMHWLVNVLVKGGAEDGFVLFRALEPTRGIAQMRVRRGVEKLEALCAGPGRLTQALGITGADDARDWCAADGDLGFFRGPALLEAVPDVRVGISRAAEQPWRFAARGSRFVSVPPGKAKARPRKRSGLR